MQKSPPPFIWACPEENNILNCKPPSARSKLMIRAFYRRKLTFAVQ